MQVLRKTRTITNQNQAEVLQMRLMKNRNRFSFFQNSGFDPSLDEAPENENFWSDFSNLIALESCLVFMANISILRRIFFLL